MRGPTYCIYMPVMMRGPNIVYMPDDERNNILYIYQLWWEEQHIVNMSVMMRGQTYCIYASYEEEDLHIVYIPVMMRGTTYCKYVSYDERTNILYICQLWWEDLHIVYTPVLMRGPTYCKPWRGDQHASYANKESEKHWTVTINFTFSSTAAY